MGHPWYPCMGSFSDDDKGFTPSSFPKLLSSGEEAWSGSLEQVSYTFFEV